MNVEAFRGTTATGRFNCLAPNPAVSFKYVYCLTKIIGGQEVVPAFALDIPDLHVVLNVAGLNAV